MPKLFRTPAIERLLPKLKVSDSGCWVFQGALNKGYGVIGEWNETRQKWLAVSAHRTAYMHFKGPIPEGLELDHLCRNRACCNPDHLDPVPHRDNVARGESAVAKQMQQIYCKRGHELSEANTWRLKDSNLRRCKICRNLARRLQYRGQRIENLGTWVR